jgi:hypothetical protein
MLNGNTVDETDGGREILFLPLVYQTFQEKPVHLHSHVVMIILLYCTLPLLSHYLPVPVKDSCLLFFV